ncbi:hypothetical protein FK268_05415 [Tsukamurella sputi]|uniref:Uncharacterized protein n=1 Tax=Tsukamurella sputi TaxID=2591848 RepID=A0A5C5RPS9_9ACTN|nr:hypothetical protein [Tsukamurella sputi]TWS24690.1 hypothetical protein FK268_05415 [Tsukamurella sputi]
MARHRREEASPLSRADVSLLDTDQFALIGTNVGRPMSTLASSDTRQMAIDSISRMIDLIDMIDSSPDPRAARRAAHRESFVHFRQIASAGSRFAHAAAARVRHPVSGRHRLSGESDRDTRAGDQNINHRWSDNAIVNTMTNEDLSVLKRAQELVRKHDEELRAQRVEREGRVRQTGSLIATYSADCALRLAELLDFSTKDGPADKIEWKLSAAGEKLISFNPEDNDLMVDMHRMPMLVANVEGYTVGVQHLLGTDVYAFGLTDGGDNWSGFEDLEGFGRATLTPGNRYKWSEVSLSEYNG